MDGITDLVMRAKGASVFDIGCNRGLVSLEMASNGATVCHGCDNFERGIQTARENFADLRSVESRFEVVDLTGGAQAVSKVFGSARYDIVLCLATYHKLKRIMPAAELSDLMMNFGRRTQQFLGWRGTSDKPAENEEEIANLDRDLATAGLKRIHTSYISEVLGVAAIWARR
jgi:hypothetical protein